VGFMKRYEVGVHRVLGISEEDKESGADDE